MSRLTKGYEKHNNEFISYVADVSLYPEMMGYEYVQADMDCINKLGKLEDLEEQLGIDLLTLFKALKDGIYLKEDNVGVISFPRLYFSLDYRCYCFEICFGSWVVKLKDYKKTWWLKKTKENEND